MVDTREPETGRRVPGVSRVLEALGVLLALGTLALGILGTLPDHPHFEVGRDVFGNIPAPLVVVFYAARSSAI